MLLDDDPRDTTPLPETYLFHSTTSARSVAVGSIYDDSPYPDLVYGLEDGRLVLVANLGDADGGQFDGFEVRDILSMDNVCSIRDMQVASLAPCTISIIMAITCGEFSNGSNNMMYSTDVPCLPTQGPSASPSLENLCDICPNDVDGTVRCLQNPNEAINLATQPGYNGTQTCGEWEEHGLTEGIVPFRCENFKEAVKDNGACGGCGTTCPAS